MGKMMKAVITDDLDNKTELPEDTAPVDFQVHGRGYRLYLSEENQTKFDETMQVYVEAASETYAPSRVRATTSKRASSPASISLADLGMTRAEFTAHPAAVRWATDNSKQLGTRGRVPVAAMEAVKAAL